MGMGDELMAVACAVNLQRKAMLLGMRNAPIHILDRHHLPRWHPLFDYYKEWIAKPAESSAGHIVNGPGVRPYIDYETTTLGSESPWHYTQWSVSSVGPAPDVWPRLAMTAGENGPAVLLHPHIKSKASPNKKWGWERWQHLADLLRGDYTLYQIGPEGTRKLDGIRLIETATFFDAIPAIKAMDLAVLPEGGLHHAAACVGTLAVVLFGHMLDPLNTGYSIHKNLAAEDSPCGERVPCGRCAEWWNELDPETVAIEIERCLKQS